MINAIIVVTALSIPIWEKYAMADFAVTPTASQFLAMTITHARQIHATRRSGVSTILIAVLVQIAALMTEIRVLKSTATKLPEHVALHQTARLRQTATMGSLVRRGILA